MVGEGVVVVVVMVVGVVVVVVVNQVIRHGYFQPVLLRCHSGEQQVSGRNIARLVRGLEHWALLTLGAVMTQKGNLTPGLQIRGSCLFFLCHQKLFAEYLLL